MQQGREKLARDIAGQLNEIALDYHLSHATFACEKLVQKVYNTYTQERRVRIASQLKRAKKRKDHEEIRKLLSEIDHLRIQFRIFVDFIPGMNETAGRTIKLDDSLTITLPQVLVDKTRKSDGTYDYNAVKLLRELMAHELGHIALHIEDILEINSTQGSHDITADELEEEADVFAGELLKLRHQRNEMLIMTELSKRVFNRERAAL